MDKLSWVPTCSCDVEGTSGTATRKKKGIRIVHDNSPNSCWTVGNIATTIIEQIRKIK